MKHKNPTAEGHIFALIENVWSKSEKNEELKEVSNAGLMA